MTLRESLRALGDLLMPRTCVVCGRVLDGGERQLCRACLDDIPHTYYWAREHNPMADRFNDCIQKHVVEGLAGAFDSRRRDSASIAAESDAFDSRRRDSASIAAEPDAAAGALVDGAGLPDVAEPYAYAEALFINKADSGYREITKSLKYRGNLEAGRMFAAMLAERIQQAPHLADIDLIIPVPLHWTRRWSRGYNQAETIARALSDALGVPCRSDLLGRVRRTRTQTHLDISQKGKNVSGAFQFKWPAAALPDASVPAPDPAAPGGPPRHILLVDDVFTTGSTMSECHKAIRAVLGPSTRISAATLACVAD